MGDDTVVNRLHRSVLPDGDTTLMEHLRQAIDQLKRVQRRAMPAVDRPVGFGDRNVLAYSASWQPFGVTGTKPTGLMLL